MLFLVFALAFSTARNVADHTPSDAALSGQCLLPVRHLVLRNISGIVVDSEGRSIPDTRVALYTVKGGRLINETRSGDNGQFAFRGVKAGHYEVVSHIDGLDFRGLTVKRPVQVATWPRGGLLRSRSLKVMLDLKPGFHPCSDIDYRR
jgi:hypothetical protein